MNFEVLTLFPDMMNAIFSQSIIGRAIAAGHISVGVTDIRSYTKDKHRRVDDTPYGGGFGMVMQCQPAVDCIRDVKSRLEGRVHTVYMSPQGKVFDHEKAKELVKSYDSIILLCGHYEGIDERIIELEIDEEISVGDFVLTGGELPAAIVVDSVSRMVDGVLPSSECYENESIAGGLLEYPQYTRPRVFEGLEVPEVLTNGNHAEINAWKYKQALERTRLKRPDIYEKYIEKNKNEQ